MPLKKKTGRPPNAYGQSLTEFSKWFQYGSQKSPQRALDPLGGAAVYVAQNIAGTSNFVHSFRVTLRPQAANSQYFWVRLETPDGSTDFTIPAPMRLDDIDKFILPRWDVEGEVWWTPSTGLPSPTMPGKMPQALIRSSHAYHVLMRERPETPMKFCLVRGAHSIPRGNFGGIVTGAHELQFLAEFFKLTKAPDGSVREVPSFPLDGAEVSPAQLSRLRAVGAAWAKHHFFDVRKTDESGEPGLWPFVPHADLLGVPHISRTELDL